MLNTSLFGVTELLNCG